MLLHIRHETRYAYDRNLGYLIQQLKLTPREEGGQRIAHWQLSAPGRTRPRQDAHGNLMHLLTLERPGDAILLSVEGVVETADEPIALPAGGLNPGVYLAPTPLTAASPELRAFARAQQARMALHDDVVDALYDLMLAVADTIAYSPGVTHAATPAAAAFAQGAGVCQDQAHTFIAVCRLLGVPARYVSGYAHVDSSAGLASHAWAEAWVEGLGWIGFDITHRRLADGRLCRLAVGRDYLDACPVRGQRVGGGRETMAVSVQIAQAQQ